MMHRILSLLIASAVASETFSMQSLSLPTTLFFTATGITQGRTPVPQLSCTGGTAAPFYRLDNLTCSSLSPISQFSESEIHWKCTTQLPHEFILGETLVNCESAVEDESRVVEDGTVGLSMDVIEGSCAVQYTIHLSELGEKRIDELARINPTQGQAKDEARSLWSWIFWTIFGGSATYMIYTALFNNAPNARQTRTSGADDGGHPGNDGDDRHDGAGGSNGSSDWSPVSQHSTMFDPAMSSRTRSTRNEPNGLLRNEPGSSSETLAPPLAPGVPTYGSGRPVTSFGGTSRR